MANRFWVGGTGSWDGTAGTKWALTSGGTGGQAIPTSVDDVYLDAASGVNTVTVATGQTGAKSINCTGFAGTLAGTTTLNVSGSVTLSAGMTITYSGTLALIGTGTVTSAGKTFSDVTINGAGITVTLGDALDVTRGSDNTIQLTQGTLALNNFSATTDSFVSSNTNTRSISFGSGNIVLTDSGSSSSNFPLQMGTATGFTWTGTGGFSYAETSSPTMRFGSTAGGSATNAPNLTCSTGGNRLFLTDNSWFKNLNLTGCTDDVEGANISIAGDLTLDASGDYINSESFVPVFVGSSTFTSNGAELSACGVNGAGITVTCADALKIRNALTHTLGTLQLKASATSTVGSFVTTGTTLKYLQSTTPGVRATLSDTSGTNAVAYLSIQDSNATGGAVFNASSNTNVDAGNNAGWLLPSSLFFVFL